jgi:hypothetical protein
MSELYLRKTGDSFGRLFILSVVVIIAEGIAVLDWLIDFNDSIAVLVIITF